MISTVGTESTNEKPVENLMALERDAIAAYEAAIERIDDADAKQSIFEFRDDHLQHVRTLEAISGEFGIKPPQMTDAKSLLTMGNDAAQHDATMPPVNMVMTWAETAKPNLSIALTPASSISHGEGSVRARRESSGGAICLRLGAVSTKNIKVSIQQTGGVYLVARDRPKAPDQACRREGH